MRYLANGNGRAAITHGNDDACFRTGTETSRNVKLWFSMVSLIKARQQGPHTEKG